MTINQVRVVILIECEIHQIDATLFLISFNSDMNEELDLKKNTSD